jgi:hypothetical protein
VFRSSYQGRSAAAVFNAARVRTEYRMEHTSLVGYWGRGI